MLWWLTGRWFIADEDTNFITDLNAHGTCCPVFSAVVTAVFIYFQSKARE